MKGVLFLAVGNSGSGKDTKIEYVTKKLPYLQKVKRHITRPQSKHTEDFISIKKKDFKKKDYFLWWESYGKIYGISNKVLIGLKKGKNYIINVSRQVIKEAKNKWKNTYLILFYYPLEELEERLGSRGREKSEEIKKRLIRAKTAPRIKPDVIIDTTPKDYSIASKKLLNFIKLICESKQ